VLSPTRQAYGLRKLRSTLVERSLRGRCFTEEYSAGIDEFAGGLFEAALRRTNRRSASGVALLAVGSLARNELTPGSDLDLVLVHDRVKAVGEIADALWYPIWDAGLRLDYSVRTPGETLAVARGDLRAAMGLLDARCVAGDASLAAQVRTRARRQWAARPREVLEPLRESMERRWAQCGELPFEIEPDVKNARGGLRDVEALVAAGIAAPSIAFATEDPRLRAAADHLLAARVALHVAAGRRSDRITADVADDIARELEFADTEHLLQSIASAGRCVAWITERAWERIAAGLTRLRARKRDGVIEPGIAVSNEELVIDGDVDDELPFRIGAMSARTGLPISPSSVERLQRAGPAPSGTWTAAARDALLDLLGTGAAAVPVVETLDQAGVLERFMPEWSSVRNVARAGAYHRYTVDRHLVECAARAADLTRSVLRPDLLLVTALLHEVAGAPHVVRRMGFDDEDAEVVARVVQNRSLLFDAATRRDVDDPATASSVARAVHDIDEVELIAALTKAAALAAETWSPWKERLVDELVAHVRACLAGEQRELTPFTPTAAQLALVESRAVNVTTDGTSIGVVAPDRPGLLALVAGVLALHRLPVRKATAASVDGMAVDTFDVDADEDDPPDVTALQADLERFLEDPDVLYRRLEHRASASRLPVRLPAPVAAPVILVDNDATPKATIVEVRAPDGFAVLSRIGTAIASCGCDIEFARVSTLGHEVVDAFYVVDAATRGRIFDPKRIEALTAAITAAL